MGDVRNERGFTLIEMIGVLAVIAILAAIVAPKIIDAIRESRINALAEEIKTIETAVANYYRDTGQLPAAHYSGQTTNKDLLRPRPGVKNWRGPYLDKDLFNPVNPNGYVNLARGGWTFDIDGDGNNDYGNGTPKPIVAILSIGGLTADQARRLSDLLDGDGDRTTGTNAWYAAGRVRTANSADPGNAANTQIYVFLAAL